MPAVGPYNGLVRSHFANPVHAGDLADEYTHTVRTQVAASEDGVLVELAAGVHEGALAAMRFRTFGCPHMIALAEEACSRLEGQQLDALQRPDLEEIALELQVPVEKTGLVLLLEDALASLEIKLGASTGRD